MYLNPQKNNILQISRLFAEAWGILSGPGIFWNTDAPSYSVLLIAKTLALFEVNTFFGLIFFTMN